MKPVPAFVVGAAVGALLVLIIVANSEEPIQQTHRDPYWFQLAKIAVANGAFGASYGLATRGA